MAGIAYLIQGEDTGHLGIEPDGISGALSEFLARSGGQQGNGKPNRVSGYGDFMPVVHELGLSQLLLIFVIILCDLLDRLGASQNISKLVGPANLYLDTLLIQMPPVPGLDERVAELGKGHAVALF